MIKYYDEVIDIWDENYIINKDWKKEIKDISDKEYRLCLNCYHRNESNAAECSNCCCESLLLSNPVVLINSERDFFVENKSLKSLKKKGKKAFKEFKNVVFLIFVEDFSNMFLEINDIPDNVLIGTTYNNGDDIDKVEELAKHSLGSNLFLKTNLFTGNIHRLSDFDFIFVEDGKGPISYNYLKLLEQQCSEMKTKAALVSWGEWIPILEWGGLKGSVSSDIENTVIDGVTYYKVGKEHSGGTFKGKHLGVNFNKFAKNDIIDYHYFSHINSPASYRKKLGIGDIYTNAATCVRCGDSIRSKNRHNFVTCNCGAVSVDGGSQYVKRCGNEEHRVDKIVLFKDRSEEY